MNRPCVGFGMFQDFEGKYCDKIGLVHEYLDVFDYFAL